MRAKCIKYGNDISTDLIIAGKYTKTLNLDELAKHAMEDLDAHFHKKVDNGFTFIVAGSNFGCGSSREQAPIALKVSKVSCIAAKSFSRIFYRNAINIGLPIIECDTDRINAGDEVEFILGENVLHNRTSHEDIHISPLPDIMVEILNDGGIQRHFARKGGF